MDTDIVSIYEKLGSTYSITLNSSLAIGFKTNIDFPILSGTSSLGRFQMFYDDISFAFYAMHDNGEVFAHWHLQTSSEAEKSVVDFMEGKVTLTQFGQPNNR